MLAAHVTCLLSPHNSFAHIFSSRRELSAKAPDLDAASSLQNVAQDGKTGEVLEADEAQAASALPWF